MKYEAVFGDQSLFDGASKLTVAIRAVPYSAKNIEVTMTQLIGLDVVNYQQYPVIAMRRIIVEPNRWTVEDQKAVPQWIPVSEQMPENEGTYFCLGHNGTPFVCLFRTTKYEGKIWLRSTGTKRVYGITHWMPLPKCPEIIK